MTDIPLPSTLAGSTDSAVANLKLPPHSLEAEQSVLGGLMLEETAWDRAAEIVSEQDFYRRDHRLIFRAIAELAAESKPRDVLTVAETLNRMGELEEAGGMAYLGEIVRAGIQSVPRGQVEAGTALGLSGAQGMRFVILPQALKNMIPSLVTQFIVLFKDTSLASIIGFMDLTKAAQVVNNREIRPFPIYLFIAVVYWVCTYSMSRYARHLEKRMGPA